MMKPLDLLRAIRSTDDRLTSAHRLLLVAIVLRADSGSWRCGRFAPSMATLGKDTAISRRHVHRLLVELEQLGMITVHRWSGLPSDYELHPKRIEELKRINVRHHVTGGSDTMSQEGVTSGHKGSDMVSHGVGHGVTHPSTSDYSAQTDNQKSRSRSRRRNSTRDRVDPTDLLMILKPDGLKELTDKAQKNIRALDNAGDLARAAALAHVTALCFAHESAPTDNGIQLWRFHRDNKIHKLLSSALIAGGGFLKAKSGELSSDFTEYLLSNS